MKFSQDWFGKIGLFAHEWGDKHIGVHVHRPRTRCQIYKMVESDFDTPEVWDILRQKIEGREEVVSGIKCPNCRMPLLNWARYWHKNDAQKIERKFCGYCGERLDASWS